MFDTIKFPRPIACAINNTQIFFLYNFFKINCPNCLKPFFVNYKNEDIKSRRRRRAINAAKKTTTPQIPTPKPNMV